VSRPTPDALPDLLERGGPRLSLWARVLCLVGGVVGLCLGVLGWLVPVVTGIPFYIAGLVLLAMASDRVGGWINRLERKMPHRWRLELRRALRRIPVEGLRRRVRLPEDDPP